MRVLKNVPQLLGILLIALFPLSNRAQLNVVYSFSHFNSAILKVESIGETFIKTSKPMPPISNGDVVSCNDEEVVVSVEVPAGISVNWYDKAQDGNLIVENSKAFFPEEAGTYFAESVKDGVASTNRTAVKYVKSYSPEVEDEVIYMCVGTPLELHLKSRNMSYTWNTGATGSSLVVNKPGTYRVTITNQYGCSSVKKYTIKKNEPPKIKKISSKEFKIIVQTESTGDYEYSLNNQAYQSSNVFENVKSGQYDIVVRARSGCGVDAVTNYEHFIIPLFFTPNGDGTNDTFDLPGIENHKKSEVSIFDRYGHLVKYTRNSAFSWDGTYQGDPVPESDYWYIIHVDSKMFTGHLTVKR